MWLYEKMFVHRGIITIEEFEQAKAMHKEEIIEAHDEGEGKIVGNGEQYYNETYGY